MELKDYTLEELKAEVKRREDEARKIRAQLRKQQGTQYAYADCKVVYMSSGPYTRRVYKVEFFNEELGKHISNFHISVDPKSFKKDTAPKLGDIVRLKSRITKFNPTGFGLFSNPKIFEIIKRAE